MKRPSIYYRELLIAAVMAAGVGALASTATGQHPHGGHPAPAPSPVTSATPAPSPATSATPARSPNPPPPVPSSTPPATEPHSMPGVTMPGMDHDAADENSLSEMRGEEMLVRVGRSERNFLSLNQMGSGTAWQPATSPMYMWQQFKGPWLLMYHAEAKIGVNAQNGPRGVTKFESQNWFMPMAIRRAGPGTLQLKGMFSFEPFTFSPGGSPQLFQTGETYQGRALVDKQHPHDLFMTLSATYSVPLGERSTWFGYLGMPGEPALGPVAFMHRASASENPSAPLSHHLQDSTHISYGVATTGFTYRWLMVEGSVFNGREPDEHRYDFEFHSWNSRSLRVSVAPTRNWVAQWSYGWLHEPETAEPGNIRRMTASLSYNQKTAGGTWSSSIIWGRNTRLHNGDASHRNGYLAETNVNFHNLNYIYSRLELTDKEHLLTRAERIQLGFAPNSHPSFRIAAFTLGGARDIWATEKLRVALGADFTLFQVPTVLNTLYGDRPAGFHFFIRFRPGRMTADSHSH